MSTTTKNKKPAVVEPKTTMDRKSTLDVAAAIGTASSIADKYKAICAARDAAENPVYKLVLSAAATAHRGAVSDAAMKAANIKEDTRKEYLFRVANLYTAALRYADTCHGGTKTAVNKSRNVLFTEWKAYLSLLTGATVKAAGADEVLLVKAATRTVKGATAYTAYEKQDGTTGARIATGAAATAAASPSYFQKELERIAVDRLCGFDGIMSYNEAKSTAANNASLRDAEVKRFESGVELVKPEAEDKPADESTAA